MPFEYSEELISDESYKAEFQKKEVFVGIGKKEYKIVKREQLDEAKKLIEDLVEETFNMCSYITDAELESKTLYDVDFITQKLKPVIENYVESYA
jgi:predicted RND superfamily exporter protein